MQSTELELTPSRIAMLGSFCVSTVTLIPLSQPLLPLGVLAWIISAVLAWRDMDKAVTRRFGVLLGIIAILSVTDINTSTKDSNFLQLGIPFFLVLVLPFLILRKTDPGVVRFRFWPKKWRKADVFYTIISIPLAWGFLKFYWWVNPEQYLNWWLPAEPDQHEISRLFIGINLVGIWDELFFVNTVYAVLRSLFRYPIANAIQAVVYTSVLYDMAFIGIGPFLVYAFAWTQGSMYEKSESLLWVLIVHLIVDFFLVVAIVASYYPDFIYIPHL